MEAGLHSSPDNLNIDHPISEIGGETVVDQRGENGIEIQLNDDSEIQMVER